MYLSKQNYNQKLFSFLTLCNQTKYFSFLSLLLYINVFRHFIIFYIIKGCHKYFISQYKIARLLINLLKSYKQNFFNLIKSLQKKKKSFPYQCMSLGTIHMNTHFSIPGCTEQLWVSGRMLPKTYDWLKICHSGYPDPDSMG